MDRNKTKRIEGEREKKKEALQRCPSQKVREKVSTRNFHHHSIDDVDVNHDVDVVDAFEMKLHMTVGIPSPS